MINVEAHAAHCRMGSTKISAKCVHSEQFGAILVTTKDYTVNEHGKPSPLLPSSS